MATQRGNSMANRGRPARDFVERVRVATWAQLLQNHQKLSAYKLELLTRGEDRTGPATGVWSKYLAGTASPSRHAVARIERRFKGAEALYHHPLWTLAGADRVDVIGLGKAVRQLPEALQDHLLEPKSREQADFWRKGRIDLKALVHAALASHVIHALALALVLMRDAELKQDQSQHLVATVIWARTVLRARDSTGLDAMFPDFVAGVGRRFIDAPHSNPPIRSLKRTLVRKSEAWLRDRALKKDLSSVAWLDADILLELRYCADPLSLLTLGALAERRFWRHLIGAGDMPKLLDCIDWN